MVRVAGMGVAIEPASTLTIRSFRADAVLDHQINTIVVIISPSGSLMGCPVIGGPLSRLHR
jgi:hypothetical protein